MAAQTVQFFTGLSKTMAQSLLAKLFNGLSRISIMPFEQCKKTTGDHAGGIDWVELSFDGADELFTIKDSFKISKDDDTEEKTKIDQKGGATIDTRITDRGDWNFEGNIPVVCAAYCDVFYEKGSTVPGTTPIVGQDGTTNYSAQAYMMESKPVEVVMLVENENVDQALAFARIKCVVSPVYESGTPAYLKLKGTVLANPEASGESGDWAICDKYTA